MNWTDLISSVLGLTCVVLAGRQSRYNFWVGYLYNIFLFALFWKQQLFAAMLLQPVAFGINIYGHWRWTHPRPEEVSATDGKSLRVSSMTPRQWGVAAAIVLIGGAVLALILRQGTADPSPWLDAFLLMLTFLAQYLSAQKKWECWIVWILVNLGNLALYLIAGLKFLPVVSVLYLVNGIWSLHSWWKGKNG